ncbi:MAG: PilZ domain-containing protein [Candidatus Desulfacyla sp.]
MDTRILLIAMENGERNIYCEAIRGFGVKVSAVPSLKGLNADVTDLYFHGVVIDMPTKIYALKNDREFIYSTLRKFPAAHVSIEKESRQIRVFYPGQDPGATLLDFINDKCRPFTPRRLGYHIRKEIHFNVILSKDRDSEISTSEKTVTVDVSEKGCFLFSVQDWAPGDTAWLTVVELSDRTPISAQVCRCVKWGTAMQVPGIGVKFNEINELQTKEISKMLWS